MSPTAARWILIGLVSTLCYGLCRGAFDFGILVSFPITVVVTFVAGMLSDRAGERR